MLRSRRWFDNPDDREMTALYLERYLNYGLTREEFATALSESFVGVWIDDMAGFGTFPIECMKSNTPVIGKIPRMIPEWMGELEDNGNLKLNDNGVWTSNLNAIPDLVATMVGLYMEDSIPTNITESMKSWSSKYSEEDLEANVTEVYTNIFNRRVVELSTILNNQKNEVEDTITIEETTEENNK